MAEHPTDGIDHELPESEDFPIGGEVLRAIRTEAEITGKHRVEVLLEAITTHHWILERIAEGCTFEMTNPDGTIDTITWQFDDPGYSRDLDPLS